MTSPTRVQIVEPAIPFVNAANQAPEYVKSWDAYVGQGPIKYQLGVYINAAMTNMERLPHTLLASGRPGVGKTTLARLIEKEMGGGLTMLVPPFTPETLYEAAMSVPDYGFLFIDEIHLLKGRADENLLHLMEEGVLYLDDGIHKLNKITVIGATTEPDELTEALLDRFAIKPFFQEYTPHELVKIVKNFSNFYNVVLPPEVMVTIAKACRNTPRVARELVEGARALQTYLNRPCTPVELLNFKEVTPDGLTRQHREYMTALIKQGRRKATGEVVYMAGEATLCSLLREKPQGLARLERYLIECGFVNRTPGGRQLTDTGYQRAVRI